MPFPGQADAVDLLYDRLDHEDRDEVIRAVVDNMGDRVNREVIDNVEPDFESLRGWNPDDDLKLAWNELRDPGRGEWIPENVMPLVSVCEDPDALWDESLEDAGVEL